MKIIGHKSGIVGLAYSGNSDARDGGAKPTLLGNCELLIVVELVELATVGSALLDSELVLDGPHGVILPLTES